jgi:hypothetical protein
MAAQNELLAEAILEDKLPTRYVLTGLVASL